MRCRNGAGRGLGSEGWKRESSGEGGLVEPVTVLIAGASIMKRHKNDSLNSRN